MTERPVSHNLPLSEAITIAAQALGEVMHGRSLGEVLEQLSAQERPIVQSLTFDALRKWTSSQELIKEFVPKTPPPETAHLLSVAIALFLHGEQKAYAAHTIVDQAVEACGQYDKTLYAKGMVNAVLRKVSQKLQAVVDKGYAPDPISMYYPAWWRANLKKSYPKEWQAIGFQQAQRAPLILRVNERQHTRDQYQAMLSQVGIASKTIDTLAGIPLPSALILEEAVPVSDLPEFYSGAVSVQDAGAQLAAILLNPQAGDLILDACAAPGGKTAHLLELADADVVALEIDKERLTRIGGNLDRLRLHSERVQILRGDASQPSWWDGRSFDKILLDAPCSASGIVARHPDIPFLRRASDIAQLQQKQQGILAQAWKMLKPDGVLLYITCSIFPEEGEDQAKWFAAEYPNALRLSAPGQILPSATNDGFYYALFKKNGS
ncbi:16S rRNA (cytosine(967)-C(5))-methyltransferase RsmB [Polynucleobacter sp. MWH-P3-07-1]|nr:16S rRNA (cytosine(967)-C(5))-methyltransferase RsmB [Polynucleobacter sp. MWH-P3-07-1]